MSKYDLYLGDILRSSELIEDSLKGLNYPKFITDKNLLDATNMRLQVIGESLNKLPARMLKRIKSVDVKRFLQTRNIVSHAYFAIKPEIIWAVAVNDVPKLKKQINNIIKEVK